jgi:hypothetical protein
MCECDSEMLRDDTGLKREECFFTVFFTAFKTTKMSSNSSSVIMKL